MVRWMADRHTADALAHDVALVCSELVTKVVLHATGPVRLTISCHDGGFLVEVGDDESSLARRAAPDEGPHATGGRGLAIVQAVAAAWGVTPDSGSKTVWALVRRRA